MAISKQITPGSISASIVLTEALPLDFPASVEVSYSVSSTDEPLFTKHGTLRISVVASDTIEQMFNSIEDAINTQEGIV